MPTTAILLTFLLVVLELRFGRVEAAETGAFLVVGCGIVAVAGAALIGVLQIAGLALLRRLPWRGPSLVIEERPDVARIFE